jgi:hypothetical protein
MKVIFSRKGFDFGSGGCPSPIFPDGRLLSLPIPGKTSPIVYKDIFRDEYNVGEIVESLTKGKISSNHPAHLDPDIDETSISRHQGWLPIFGQVGNAQGHLRKEGVGAGDLFLFFGLFQETIIDNGKIKLKPKFPPQHIIWGWLQVEQCIAVDEIDRSKFAWAIYHPHFHRKPDESNTVYFAKRTLDIPGLGGKTIGGAGIFAKFLDKLKLTAPASSASVWKLPPWMFPKNEAPALSFHRNLDRWKKCDGYVLLQTVGRGQEFVWDCLHYPNSIQWLNSLFTS